VHPGRFLTLDPDNEPFWVRLYVHPVADQWAALFVAEEAEPPKSGEVKGLVFFGATAAEAKAHALRYLGRCSEQN
jgi:hypothetical protein